MLYLVSEGDIYTRDTAPEYLRGHNFGDWAIFEARDEAEALEMAKKFDAAVNTRRGSIFLRRKNEMLLAMRLREEYAELTAFEWLDAAPYPIRFSRYGFGRS